MVLNASGAFNSGIKIFEFAVTEIPSNFVISSRYISDTSSKENIVHTLNQYRDQHNWNKDAKPKVVCTFDFYRSVV